MPPTIRLGISTCPNDTFAFHAILEHKIDFRGLDLAVELHDIQQLNELLANGRLDIAKVSFFAGLKLGAAVRGLPCGAALGFGVGPILLANRPISLEADLAVESPNPPEILCPGPETTAAFLCQAVLPRRPVLRHATFSAIIPALLAGRASLGACIHEARFVWRQRGLHLAADLGALWESQTGHPVPLGGLFAQADLPRDIISRAAAVIRESIEYGFAHRAETVSTMRRYAQEFEEEILFAHVDLYVNEWTVDLGLVGREALAAMHRVARHRGLIEASEPPPVVVD